MKIKDCFVLRNIAGVNTVIAANSQSKFEGVITLNETAVFMWNVLKDGATLDELVEKMMKEYDIEKAVASRDAEAFIKKLNDIDVFE